MWMDRLRTPAAAMIAFVLVCLFAASLAAGASASAGDDDFKVYLPVVTNPGTSTTPSGSPGSCLTPEEMKLASMINDYRAARGLPAAPLSPSMSMVAQYHVRDLQDNHPNAGTDSRGSVCNLHSWSNRGHWNPVCYTSDHYYASGMWNKPSEVTRGQFTGTGFEISVGGEGWTATANEALNAWKSSPGHNDVILENGIWEGSRWPAMGVGIYRGYAVVWFSDKGDSLGPIQQCPQ